MTVSFSIPHRSIIHLDFLLEGPSKPHPIRCGGLVLIDTAVAAAYGSRRVDKYSGSAKYNHEDVHSLTYRIHSAREEQRRMKRE